MGNGTDFLSQTEISLTLDAIKEINRTKPPDVRAQMQPDIDISNGTQEYVTSMTDGSHSAGRNSDIMGSKYVTLAGNGGSEIEIEYKTDGSEVHTYYDADGNTTDVAYRSSEYVADYNSKMAGTAFETTQYMKVASSAQSGGGTPQDFRIYTQPDPINMNTNPDGNHVVATLIAAFQFENANPNGGQSRRMSTYLTNARGVSFNYPTIDFEHRGGRFRMNNLTLTFDGAGNLSWTSPGNGIAPLNQQFNEALRVRDNAFLNWQGIPSNNTQPLFSNYPAGYEFLPK